MSSKCMLVHECSYMVVEGHWPFSQVEMECIEDEGDEKAAKSHHDDEV